MTPLTEWTVASKGPVVSIGIRGDTMFGLGPDSLTYEQPLSRMTIYSQWTRSMLEDDKLSPEKTISILAHNDMMYAIGEDNAVYSKLIDKPITYKPGLSFTGNTHKQALFFNLTDLPAPATPDLKEDEDEEDDPSWVPPRTTPIWEASTTTIANRKQLAEGNGNNAAKGADEGSGEGATTVMEGATTTTVEKRETTTTVEQVIDCFGDTKSAECGKASEAQARRGADIGAPWFMVVLSLIVFQALPNLAHVPSSSGQ